VLDPGYEVKREVLEEVLAGGIVDAPPGTPSEADPREAEGLQLLFNRRAVDLDLKKRPHRSPLRWFR